MAKHPLHHFIALCCATLPLFASAADAASAPASEKIARGLLLQHAGRMIFTPCRERTYVQLEDTSPDQQLSAALVKLGLAENKPLYVEFTGLAEADRLKVSWINFAHTDARCQASANPDEKWRALGAAPDWTMHLSEQQVRLNEAGQPEFRHHEVVIAAGSATVAITVGKEQPEQWLLTRQLCRSQDKNSLFGWQAELRRPGKVLRGCAWQGY